MAISDAVPVPALAVSAQEPPSLRLAVIIPATNKPPTLDRCLEAIHASTSPPEKVIVVEGPANDGPASARNSAVGEASDADVLVFVDADVLVHPDALARIREAFAEDPGLGAVFGSYDDAPEARSPVSLFRNLLHHHVHQESAGGAESFWAGLGAVRREHFVEVGGFNARRFARPSVEDIDLGMRLARQGTRIRLDPRVQGIHLKRWTLKTMVHTDFRHRGMPWTALLLTNRGGSYSLNLGWRHRLSALVSLGIVAAVLGVILSPTILSVPMMVGSTSALVALNWSFLRLLWRNGPWLGVGGVALLILHYLTAACAIPLGFWLAGRWRRRDAIDAEAQTNHA